MLAKVVRSFELVFEYGRVRVLAALLFVAAPAFLSAAEVHEKGIEPLVISNGQKVALTDYLVPGKTTVFDFYSEFCPTCRSIAPDMRKLHASRADLAVVFVNVNRPGLKVIDWQSPVVKQYALPSTPQLKVFGPDGKLVAEGKPAYKLVTGWFK
jgi:thiol-disulfide isomerase/thioredoxin